jgi:hypothetical protein
VSEDDDDIFVVVELLVGPFFAYDWSISLDCFLSSLSYMYHHRGMIVERVVCSLFFTQRFKIYF